jgi:hypothetical protein
MMAGNSILIVMDYSYWKINKAITAIVTPMMFKEV